MTTMFVPSSSAPGVSAPGLVPTAVAWPNCVGSAPANKASCKAKSSGLKVASAVAKSWTLVKVSAVGDQDWPFSITTLSPVTILISILDPTEVIICSKSKTSSPIVKTR